MPWGALGKDSGCGGTFTWVRTWARASRNWPLLWSARYNRCQFLFGGADYQRAPYSIGPVAQLVEHRTFNAAVAGSSPTRLTKSHPLDWFWLFLQNESDRLVC